MIRPGDASIGDVPREPTLRVIMLRKGGAQLINKNRLQYSNFMRGWSLGSVLESTSNSISNLEENEESHENITRLGVWSEIQGPCSMNSIPHVSRDIAE